MSSATTHVEHAKTIAGSVGKQSRTPGLEIVSPESRDRRLLRALDLMDKGEIPRRVLPEMLARAGLHRDDVRLAESMAMLAEYPEDGTLSHAQMLEVMRPNVTLIERALSGHLVIPDFVSFCDDLRDIYRVVRNNESGKVADYIPQLARVRPENFGMSVCTIDGQRFGLGETREHFSVQSCTKPINYCLALEEHGNETYHKYVGREPSGRGFNELTLNKDHKPHNPMINSGAIATCALVRRDRPSADRFDFIIEQWTKLAGGSKPGFSNAVYLSERQTADRNFALGYFMKEKGVFPPDIDLLATLEFYFQCCSIESNCDAMAVVAASLANGGVCPITGVRVLKPETVRACLSLMYSCGMYDFSGEFAFSIGLPAKSGVSGALMLVVPNVAGFCIWSPALDAVGNSVRGVEFCRGLVDRFNFHNYDHLAGFLEHKKDPRRREDEMRVDVVSSLLWAASQGDVRGIEGLLARGARLEVADYDGRTAMHLAASEGHATVVTAFLARSAAHSPRDRWGNTPLDDALRGGHSSVVEILQAAGARRGADLS